MGDLSFSAGQSGCCRKPAGCTNERDDCLHKQRKFSPSRCQASRVNPATGQHEQCVLSAHGPERECVCRPLGYVARGAG